MLKITNGRLTLTVSKGSYQSVYQHQGYFVLEDDSTVSKPLVGNYSPEEITEHLEDPTQEDARENADDEEAVPERKLEEIPLSEMDYYQLRAYADQLGVDRTGLRSTKDLRRVIRAALKGE